MAPVGPPPVPGLGCPADLLQRGPRRAVTRLDDLREGGGRPGAQADRSRPSHQGQLVGGERWVQPPTIFLAQGELNRAGPPPGPPSQRPRIDG
eukprot:4471692-Pyramimonas_sp.AAC.1